MDIRIDEESGTVSSDFGEIEFVIDEDCISIFQIFALKKRCGIGSNLLQKLEEFAIERDLRKIIVPVTPSRLALSFWLKAGYYYVFPEEMIIGNAILKEKDSGKIRDTDSGIILLEKALGDNYEQSRRVH
jgi:GNAT superfamily N-acetyltransferase